MNKVHCWKDYREYVDEKSKGCTTFTGPSMTCMLMDGHEGPHEWTPDSDITVEFIDAQP